MLNQLAGIYIHIPFCKQACHYCNFHFSTSLTRKNELVAALLREIDLRQNYLQQEAVETIYFGGGTPSLLQATDIQSQVDRIRSSFLVTGDAEITLEANPDDITEERVAHWRSAGINRLSLGTQSFFEEDLRWMNRAHTANQAIHSLEIITRFFDNITVDLIYGSPALTREKWKQNVDRLLAFNIPHLSCYALTVEQKTPLQKMISQGKSENIDPDKQSVQFLLLMEWLADAGYEHYEISNFAKPGFRSRHNSSYWQGKKYLGIGPSAHSFNGTSRQWNVSNNNIYINSIQTGTVPFEIETLTNNQQLNEYIMTSLRTVEGIDLKSVEERFGTDTSNIILETSKKYLDENKMRRTATGNLQLTPAGKLLADGIASDLFIL